ncbi:MAG: ABC transporter ATP-binding protein/permease [Verrucomicrobia bacterium]|nr:ABC transporter ATP-binding protein/permease [Verrucomicrobiota bacterium]
MTDDLPDSLPAVPSRRLLTRILRYTRPYAGWMALSLLLLLGMSLALNVLPVLIKHAIDTWIVAGGLPAPERIAGLTHDGLVYLAIASVAFTVRFGESLLTAWIGQRIVYDVRADVFRKTHALDLAFYDRTPVGRLMTRVTSDVEAVQRFVTEGVVGALADLFMLAGVIGFMFVLHPRLAALVLAAMPPLFAALFWANQHLRLANRRIRERTSSLNAMLQEQLAGMGTIQLFNREAQARERFGERNAALRDAHFEEVRWFSIYWPVLEISQAVSIVLVLLAGGLAILRADTAVTLGILAAFLSYVRDFYRPLGALADKAGMMQQAMASAERLFDLLDTPVGIEDPKEGEAGKRGGSGSGSRLPAPGSPLPVPDSPRSIRFDHVWFSYIEGHWVLEDVDLDIRPGESVAVVGATGSGKSTMASLLSRFYDVQQGAVLVGGVDVRGLPQRELRRRIGLVLQEPFVFSGTLAANIALANPGLPRARIEEAAHFVNAHRFIERMPQGYDTVVGERGGSLSTGEKQLLALARVIASDPEVLVVLDEATANVDSETERLIQEAVHRMMRGRTSLVIAHRLSTIRDADRIVVLRRGRITAQGPHEDLIARDPYYRHLYELLGVSSSKSQAPE